MIIKGKKSSAKWEYHDENVFLKAYRALSKLNFLFDLKSKINLVTFRKCNSDFIYHETDLNLIIKLQEIDLNIC